VTYRLRVDNSGYKAGNIRDFCNRWGHRHDFALVLDADSLMSANTILRMVRTMQRHPRLGILQSLVVGMPTVSPFARIFQFGMRLGMRSYTLGSAWWQADCGPYWGHNALVRLQPFIKHCDLPVLPGDGPLGGHILSHDQVEAVLMRRAGYEVRVLPDEGGSWEENPPTLVEHMRRDLRWCHGNMQYWRLLAMPDLQPVSRMQLVLAILMYLGSAAWVGLMTLSVLRAGIAEDPSQIFRAEPGMVLLAIILVMVFAPKIATVVDVLASRDSRRAFGGSFSIVSSTLGEAVFSALLAPVLALAHTRFLLGLPFGRAAVWAVQRRSTHRVTPGEAAARLWPQTLFATAMFVWLLVTAPLMLLGFLPFLVGAVLAIPIAVLTSWAGLGIALASRSGLWRIPDETAPAAELRAIRLPALRRSRQALAATRAAFESGS
jgi:membrane glycosyltransferase